MRNFKVNVRIFTLLLSLLLIGLLSSFLLFKNNPKFNSSQTEKNEVLEGLEDDNWELSIVFYDSSVDNGNTPLTEINWHADDQTERREIKIQVNYKNTNTQRQYNPNDIKIELDRFKGRNNGGTSGNYKRGLPKQAASAGSLEDGYDWNGGEGYDTQNQAPYYTFFNNVTIEEHTNVEGSLQLVYSFTPTIYFSSMYGDDYDSVNATIFNNEITEVLKARLKYKNNIVATSNELRFSFESEKKEYTVEEKPIKVTALDGFKDANDYIWVKWEIKTNSTDVKPRFAHFSYFTTQLPEGAVAYNNNQEELIVNSDGTITIDHPYPEYCNNFDFAHTFNYYVGYPKSEYEQQEITSTIQLHGTYEDEENPSLLSEYTKTIDLANYEFTYPGVLYKIRKPETHLYTAESNNSTAEMEARIIPTIIYTGTKYDAIISDDVMVLPMENGSYQILDDSQYNITRIRIPYKLYNGNGGRITGNTIDIFVRYANTDEYVEYPEKMVLGETEKIEFTETNIVDAKVIIRDLEVGIGSGEIEFLFNMHTSGIAEEGTGYNLALLQIRKADGSGEIMNTPDLSSYNTYNRYVNLSDFDLENYGMYVQRTSGNIYMHPNQIGILTSNTMSEKTEYPNLGYYKLSGYMSADLSMSHGFSNRFNGLQMVELLPEGMELLTTQEEIYDYMIEYNHTYDQGNNIKTQSGLLFENREDFDDYYREHLHIDIINNYNNTNRTLLNFRMDFTDDPLILSIKREEFIAPRFIMFLDYKVSYDSILEFGGNWSADMYAYVIDGAHEDFNTSCPYGNGGTETNDYNFNGINGEMYCKQTANATIVTALESHQDVQTSVQSDLSNYATGKVNVLKDDEYTYKLRVRTGQNNVTNLVIYDSIEDYAKNPDLEIIKASQGKPSWQGELIDIDTSYAESKGYTVKVYYNTNPNPGTLANDNTWQEYTAATNKNDIKAVAFKYLDDEGNSAVLPANTNTYVLIKMKSPNEDLKTFTYNGCWTEWNAIDATTGRPVDFITGINSNIVKVALPTSVEPADVNITLKKVWADKYDTLGLRPNSVNFKIIPNDDYANATEVPLSGSGNEWTTQIAVPNYDDYGEIINYIIREDTIDLGNGYKYIPTVENYTITNTLNKDITLTKVWKDNTNAYSTRPSNVTFKIKQNGTDYKTVTFGGNLTLNVWTETITVPVYSSNGSEYNYTIEEVEVENYSSSCTNYTCTNTLTGNENITVKKVWEDKSNAYNSRPDSIDIRLKQNNNAYQSVTLTGTTNTWTSDEITVPKYDSNGVKYTYTIEETQVTDYGQVTYDQANLKVTNTLKKNVAITITKKWIDDSNALDLRPNSLTITLQRNGSDYQNVTLTGTTDTWTTTIEVPKYDDNQAEYTYTIKEVLDGLNEDYSNISYSQGELSVTNTLEKKTNLTISKIWDDGDNKLLTRPESISINLLRNGTLFQELEIIPDDIQENTWSTTVENVDVYDRNGAKYTYTIEENLEDQLERYETITYDQTTLTITNKLTLPPKVTLYFTVKNGYTLPGNDDLLYDQEGYNDVLSRYDLNGDDEYLFHFELENVETGEIIEGKLSTQGTLEFDDVPYGTYRAREGEDKYFSFVSMIEIEEVLGVTFTQDEMGGTITISPTGHDIVYGAQITNKIEIPVENPETNTLRNTIYIAIIILLLNAFIGLKLYNKYSFLK